MAKLNDKHVVVTGASRGIGATIAEHLAQQGARLSLISRGREALETRATALRQAGAEHVIAAPADVTDRQAIRDALAHARDAHGPVSVLINNAGAATSAPFRKTDDALWQHMLAMNLTSVYACSQEVLEDMKSAGWGRIINVASTAGLVGYRYVTAYCAAKHGVIGLTRSLALELAHRGVTVNAVCPGYTDTPMLAASIDNIVAKTGCTQEEARAQLAESNPMGRLIAPDEVAGAVAWLCSEAARSVTGQAITIDGGEVMH